MSRKPLEHLSATVAAGRQNVEQLIKTLIDFGRPELRTREWVLPIKDSAILEWIREEKCNRRDPAGSDFQPNRLIQGDDPQVMAALLAEDDAGSPLRDRIDLIFLDPLLASAEAGSSCASESESADDPERCLSRIALRLMFAHQLLSRQGTLCMRLDWRVLPHVSAIIDGVFDYSGLTCRMLCEDISAQVGAAETLRSSGDLVLLCRKNASPLIWKDAFQEIGNYRPLSLKARQADANELAQSAAQDAAARRLKQRAWQALMEKIISQFSDSDSIVTDMSASAGPMIAVAERLRRRWVAFAGSADACRRMRKRLAKQNVKPFLFQIVKNSSRSGRRNAGFGRAEGAGNLAHLVLLLYGASPLPPKKSLDCLGRIVSNHGRILVLVDIPGRPTGEEMLARAIAQCDSAPGAWDKVVVLGWEFEPSIFSSIAALDDDRIDVVLISPELLDMLNNNGAISKPEGNSWFISLLGEDGVNQR